MSRHNCVYLIRFLGLLAGLLLSGCGNEFRPVAIPIIPPGGTPQAQKHVVVVSDSSLGGTSVGGTSTNIDVAGDTLFAVRDIGTAPVAAGLVGARTVVANSNGPLSTYVTFGSLTVAPISTISLPAGSMPVFVHSREASNAYVVLQAPDPSCGGTNGSVAVVSLTSLALASTVCVGDHPVAMTELPNQSKLYVVNQGSNDVTVINTVDRSIATTIPVGNSPSAIEVSADGSFVYVANTGDNNVSVISTVTDQEFPAHPRVDVSPGVGPNFLKYGECPGQSGGAPTRKRIYVTNPGSDSVSVIDADSSNAATFLTVSNVSVGDSPVALSPLANCAKIYVANGPSANSVSVIDGASLAVTATVPVGITPIGIVSSPDSGQVFVANQGTPTVSGNVSVIRTSDDTKTTDIALPLPPSLPPPPPGSPVPVTTPKALLVTP